MHHGTDFIGCRRGEGGASTTLPVRCAASLSLTHAHGEIGHTNSDVQKRDGQTDRQKTQRFWLPRRRVKSEPHQTWHGDRGPRARFFTSKTWGVTHSFAARGGENLEVTRPRQLNPFAPEFP